jgi:hypothetical protein
MKNNFLSFSGYIECVRKKWRLIPEHKTWINRNTPVGESVEYYECKPYGGRKEFYPILEISNGIITNCYRKIYNWNEKRWEFFLSKKFKEFLILSNIKILKIIEDVHVIEEQ